MSPRTSCRCFGCGRRLLEANGKFSTSSASVEGIRVDTTVLVVVVGVVVVAQVRRASRLAVPATDVGVSQRSCETRRRGVTIAVAAERPCIHRLCRAGCWELA
jgi:hypothetical protein